MRVGPDTLVKLTYVLFDQDGNVAGEAGSDDPLTYVHGYAQIVPGLERGVVGLAKGERREIVVDPEEAFGDTDDKAILELDRADLPEQGSTLNVGDELIAEDDDDEQLMMREVELRKDTVVVDTNTRSPARRSASRSRCTTSAPPPKRRSPRPKPSSRRAPR